MNEIYILNQFSRVVDLYSKMYDWIIIMGGGGSTQKPPMNTLKLSAEAIIYIIWLKEKHVSKVHLNVTT